MLSRPSSPQTRSSQKSPQGPVCGRSSAADICVDGVERGFPESNEGMNASVKCWAIWESAVHVKAYREPALCVEGRCLNPLHQRCWRSTSLATAFFVSEDPGAVCFISHLDLKRLMQPPSSELKDRQGLVGAPTQARGHKILCEKKTMDLYKDHCFQIRDSREPRENARGVFELSLSQSCRHT